MVSPGAYKTPRMDSLPHKIELCKPPNPHQAFLDFPHSLGSPEVPGWGSQQQATGCCDFCRSKCETPQLCFSSTSTFIISSSFQSMLGGS